MDTMRKCALSSMNSLTLVMFFLLREQIHISSDTSTCIRNFTDIKK